MLLCGANALAIITFDVHHHLIDLCTCLLNAKYL